MAALPTFITVSEAAQDLGVSESSLRRMIGAGTIKAAQISGETFVSESSVRKFHKQQPIRQPGGVKKEELPEYKQYAHLRGIGIGVRQAGSKYTIPNQTIVRWAQRGFVQVLGTDKNKILLNEQDVAYCAEIYHARQGRGKWLFRSDGTPYVPRSEKAQTTA